ncbi:radial spoke head 14 homolog [Sycon ciliatum]|uniref:radial spoke head 14 homolog n=1 Tax=Sycon ciliatum TaxID=27933 RepID=UPI0031F662E8
MITKFDDSVSRVRTSAYNTVLNLCSSIPGVQAIIDCSMVPILVTNLAAESEDIQLIILDILHCCSPVNGQLTLSCGGLQTALSLMGSGSLPALRAKATRTVMELCNSAEGKVKACDEVTLIPRLVELLGDNESDVRTAAAGALMVIVVTTRGKFCVLEADGLEALLKLTASSEDQHTILNSVKALTCLAEAAQGRKQLLNHLDQFTPLKRHPSRAVVEATNTAIKVITWKP